ncbi:MAG: type II secretion system F family protein [Anaerolineae bacterium]|nr:type II secretion system F family protein [Anaerolineae bacterium]
MTLTLVLWVGGGLALLLILVGVVITITGEKSLVEERVGKYLEETPQELEFGESEGQDSAFLTDWINTRVEKSSFGENIKRELAQADLQLKPGEYVAIIGLSSIGLGVFSYYFFNQSILFALLGFVLGPFIPRIFVKRQQAGRLKRFSDQLPDMLNLMVNGLRAGFSTMQAMEAVSRELPAPISDEFRRVVQEMQLGIPMEKAMENLLRRIPSDDLDLVITAINVQREVGGNLSEILENISHTIRERIRIKGEIKTLTAQVVYSGRFLSVLPVILSLVLWAVNRPYMMQFFLEPRVCGIGMLCCGAVMIVIGYAAMAKIADIEV